MAFGHRPPSIPLLDVRLVGTSPIKCPQRARRQRASVRYSLASTGAIQIAAKESRLTWEGDR